MQTHENGVLQGRRATTQPVARAGDAKAQREARRGRSAPDGPPSPLCRRTCNYSRSSGSRCSLTWLPFDRETAVAHLCIAVHRRSVQGARQAARRGRCRTQRGGGGSPRALLHPSARAAAFHASATPQREAPGAQSLSRTV